MNNDAKEKVKDYDRNRKRQVRRSEYVVCGNSVSNAKLFKEEGCEIKPSSSFEASAKKVVKETIQSPNKKEILVQYFKEKGFDVDLDAVEKKKFSVLQLRSFKLQNRAADHRKLVQDIVDHYGSISKAAKSLNVYYSTFYNLCQPIKQKVHRKTQQKLCNESTIKEFFDLKSTTTSFPQARLANKQYMNSTYEEGYFKYVDWCKEKGYPAVSNKTFHRLKPENVYKLSDTPENMCVCMLCQNFKKGRECIDKYKINGVAKHSNEIMLQSMCSVTDADLRNGVLKEYGNYNCITRNCAVCGYKMKGSKKVRSDYYEKMLKRANPGIYSEKKIIEWQRWETVTRLTKKGTEIKKPEKVDKSGTLKQFLQTFLQDVHDMALHLFNWKWHDSQFQFLKDNLKPGMLAMVLDFAQNYMNVYVDEPQGCHWDHTQTVIHPIVSYRRCAKDGKLITEEHIMISDDLTHDKFAVKRFEEESVSNIRTEESFEPTCIVQFCDNCSSQYKSKGPFQYISTSDVPTMRTYFGANHGKGPSDAATGRVKIALSRARKSRKYELRTPFEVYKYLDEHFKQKMEERRKKNPNKCEHFKQKVFFVTDIDRSDSIEAVTTKSSKKFSTIRSTGEPFIVEARNVACCCPNCMFQDCSACPSKHYAGEWKQYDLRLGKELDNEYCSHWKNIDLENLAEDIISSQSTLNEDSQDETIYGSCDIEQDKSVSNNSEINCNVSNKGECISFDLIGGEFNWNQLYSQMQTCQNFDELHLLCANCQLPQKDFTPCNLNRLHVVDDSALDHLPVDAPDGFLPVRIYGDGNCFPRALCVALGIDANTYHKEMRIRICHEGVSNKARYLNNSYIATGSKNSYSRTTFPIIYAQMSEYRCDFGFNDGESIASRLMRWSVTSAQIYKEETYMLRRCGEWMGMWQLFQAANVIKRPICSVYPHWLSRQLRGDMNRTIFPFDASLREKEPIYIMWTSTTSSNTPNHFVPLLK